MPYGRVDGKCLGHRHPRLVIRGARLHRELGGNGPVSLPRAVGFGKWVQAGQVVTLYAADGVTAVRAFTLGNPAAPRVRE